MPVSFARDASNRVVATYKNATTGETTSEVRANGPLVLTTSQTYDTVLLAIGRYALTDQCNLEAVGVKVGHPFGAP